MLRATQDWWRFVCLAIGQCSQALDFRIKGNAEHYGGEKWNLKAEIGRYAAVPQGQKLYPCFTCHTSVMRFAGMHLQKYATQKRRTNGLVHVDPVPKTKSSVGGKAISCSISISKCRLQRSEMTTEQRRDTTKCFRFMSTNYHDPNLLKRSHSTTWMHMMHACNKHAPIKLLYVRKTILWRKLLVRTCLAIFFCITFRSPSDMAVYDIIQPLSISTCPCGIADILDLSDWSTR
jgi:hypothetical protein